MIIIPLIGYARDVPTIPALLDFYNGDVRGRHAPQARSFGTKPSFIGKQKGAAKSGS